jgi:excinuclease UvrABC nuclease subunit
MRDAATNLEFELAATLRDQILELKSLGAAGAGRPSPQRRARPARRRA